MPAQFPKQRKATPEACRCDQDVTTCLKSQLVAICLFPALTPCYQPRRTTTPTWTTTTWARRPLSDNRETRSRPPGALENHPDIAKMLFPKYWRIQPRLECLPPSSGGIHTRLKAPRNPVVASRGPARKYFPQSTGAFRARAIYVSPP